MSVDCSVLVERLTPVLKEALPGFQSIDSIAPLTAGASRLTFRLTASTSTGEQVLALRMDAADSAPAPAREGQLSLGDEATLLRMAAAQQVAVPEVLCELPSDCGLSGYLMPWLSGESLGHKIVYADTYQEARTDLAAQCGVALANIHSIDVDAISNDCQLPHYQTEALVQSTWQGYADLGIPIPIIDYVYCWLQQNLPSKPRKTLVHGDFRNGNLMIDEQGLLAVLDWELAHVGDPVRDLGWLCVNSWRFGNDGLPVGGFGELDDLLVAYEQHSGEKIASTELLFWQVFGSFWWAITTLLMADEWRTGTVKSLERPVIGRRSSEAQLDCANLLFAGQLELRYEPRDLAKRQLPSSIEMLQGVKAFLVSEVLAKLEPHEQFLSKVAANSLGILERELLYGELFEAQEQSRLENYLESTGSLHDLRRSLVERIHRDQLLDDARLQDHLRITAVAQVSIDQPKYSGLRAVLSK